MLNNSTNGQVYNAVLAKMLLRYYVPILYILYLRMNVNLTSSMVMSKANLDFDSNGMN